MFILVGTFCHTTIDTIMKRPPSSAVIMIALAVLTPENSTILAHHRPIATLTGIIRRTARTTTGIMMTSERQQQDHSDAVPVDVVLNSAEIARIRASSNSAAATQNFNNRLALIKQLQGGLAKLSTVVPKPVLYAAVAVLSGLLFFEMSRLVSAFSLPLLLVMGAGQSIAEKFQEVSQGPRVVETDVLEDELATDTVGDRIRRTIKEAEEQRIESDRRLNEISQRTEQAGQDLRAAISSASFLRNKISSYREKLNNLNED